MSDVKRHLVRAQKAPEQVLPHPHGQNSPVEYEMLGSVSGMRRIGVNLMKIPPGKESFIDGQQTEEEFIYVISGRGVLEADNAKTEIESGDFIGFSTPFATHLVKNPNEEVLVCLMVRENGKS